MGGVRSRSAFGLVLLLSAPAALAQDGKVAVHCVDVAQPQGAMSFILDFERESVAGALPANWVWFTRSFVLFQYSTLINGHQHTMQSYTLDRATWVLEICDFAAGQDQACRQLSCAVAHPDVQAALQPHERTQHHRATDSPRSQ